MKKICARIDRPSLGVRLLCFFTFLLPVVQCVRVSADNPDGASELPVWAVSFNLGILDKYVQTDDFHKQCRFLFPTNAVVNENTFEVLTLQWEAGGFWLTGSKSGHGAKPISPNQSESGDGHLRWIQKPDEHGHSWYTDSDPNHSNIQVTIDVDDTLGRHPGEAVADRSVYFWTREARIGEAVVRSKYMVFESTKLQLVTLVRFPSFDTKRYVQFISNSFDSPHSRGHQFIVVRDSCFRHVVTIGNTYVSRYLRQKDCFRSFEFVTNNLHSGKALPFVLGGYFQSRTPATYFGDEYNAISNIKNDQRVVHETASSQDRWRHSWASFATDTLAVYGDKLRVSPNKQKFEYGTFAESSVADDFHTFALPAWYWFVGNHLFFSGHCGSNEWHVNPFQQDQTGVWDLRSADNDGSHFALPVTDQYRLGSLVKTRDESNAFVVECSIVGLLDSNEDPIVSFRAEREEDPPHEQGIAVTKQEYIDVLGKYGAHLCDVEINAVLDRDASELPRVEKYSVRYRNGSIDVLHRHEFVPVEFLPSQIFHGFVFAHILIPGFVAETPVLPPTFTTRSQLSVMSYCVRS